MDLLLVALVLVVVISAAMLAGAFIYRHQAQARRELLAKRVAREAAARTARAITSGETWHSSQ